jgi:hexosaminidase
VVYQERGASIPVANALFIRYEAGLEREADYLAKLLQTPLGTRPKTELGSKPEAGAVLLRTGEVKVAGETKQAKSEAYTLDITAANGIVITGADSAGVFYGIQSFLQLLPPTAFTGTQRSLTVPAAYVEDAPRFAYRGQHIDVSHNFHGKESILKLLDRMAFYKLNTFHFQVSDDEGWRIEIPQLPELTEISGGRAHTRDHDGVLHPTYGAGPFRDPPTFGTGFYTRNEFINILRHARDRHIRVIPEINLPAHARGALVALKTREKRLLAQGKTKEALEYRLHDPDDTSKYISAQGFLDNAVCVVDEPVYHFAETIIRNFEEMFSEADMPLDTFHFGADEVPQGVWTGSPRCAAFLKEHPELKGPADLKNYFVRRMIDILQKRKLQAACWQEAALDHELMNGIVRDNPIPEFAGGKLVSYVWNNTHGNEDLCNRFANLGYPVVMCSVSNLYYDLAYNNDPLEPGLTWGGFCDVRSPFEFVPEDVFKSTRENNFGHPHDRAAMYQQRQPLTAEGRKNILGIQGQIWCETIKGPKMLEYAVFPKLIGLAERAWAAQPEWAKSSDLKQHDAAVEKAWNEFANRLGQRELPRLDAIFGGIGYRLPPPGGEIENGKLHASSEYPGLVIRYATDGSDPTASSPEYQGPVAVKVPVKLSTFDTTGRASRVSTVE